MTTEDKQGRIAWRLFDALFIVLLGLLTAAGGLLVQEVRDMRHESVLMRERLVAIETSQIGMASDRFRDADGLALELRQAKEIRSVWEEVEELKLQIARINLPEWKERVRVLEQKSHGGNGHGGYE